MESYLHELNPVHALDWTHACDARRRLAAQVLLRIGNAGNRRLTLYPLNTASLSFPRPHLLFPPLQHCLPLSSPSTSSFPSPTAAAQAARSPRQSLCRLDAAASLHPAGLLRLPIAKLGHSSRRSSRPQRAPGGRVGAGGGTADPAGAGGAGRSGRGRSSRGS